MLYYVQGVMLTVIEMLCCKIFFETFSKKRSENKWKNKGIILFLTIFVYLVALWLYDLFFLKQMVIILGTAILMILYLKIRFWKAIILSLLFQGLLLSIDYFTHLVKCFAFL